MTRAAGINASHAAFDYTVPTCTHLDSPGLMSGLGGRRRLRKLGAEHRSSDIDKPLHRWFQTAERSDVRRVKRQAKGFPSEHDILGEIVTGEIARSPAQGIREKSP